MPFFYLSLSESGTSAVRYLSWVRVSGFQPQSLKESLDGLTVSRRHGLVLASPKSALSDTCAFEGLTLDATLGPASPASFGTSGLFG